jgi:hypothetical protein
LKLKKISLLLNEKRFVVLAQNVKISLDIKALLRIILHANIVRIRAFTCLNKAQSTSTNVMSKHIFWQQESIGNGQSKISNLKYFNQTPMPNVKQFLHMFN